MKAPNAFKIQSGRMRTRVTINHYVAQNDDQGGQSQVPTVFQTSYIYIRELTGQEIYVAQQQKMSVTCAAELRFVPGLSDDMWLTTLLDRTTFAIRSIIDVELRRRKHLLMLELRKDLR